MADVVGVIFPNGTKTYYFDPDGLELARGDRVVVQTATGPEIGQVAESSHPVDDAELVAPLKKVTRLATVEDLKTHAIAQDMRKQAMITCREMIVRHGLDMKLVGADISFGGEKITFSFYADERVDFRALVSDLAKALKTRIELRQVGAREEARMVGGLGPCGRSLCCTLFPSGDDPVSIRMAKEQNLPLNPAKISGLCGRLMCCLKYEQEQYVQFRKEAPAKGTPVQTPGGQAVVVGYNVLKDAITVRTEDGHTSDIKMCRCQCQADGGVLVVPELGEPAPSPELLESAAGTEALPAGAGTGAEEEELTVVEAEVVLGEDGQPIEVIVAETKRRSRRSRGRRGGRGRSKAGDGESPAGEAGGKSEGGKPRSGQHAVRQPERQRTGGDAGTKQGDRAAASGRTSGTPVAGPEGQAPAGPTGSGSRSRSRRRRRPAGGAPAANGGGGQAEAAGGAQPEGRTD